MAVAHAPEPMSRAVLEEALATAQGQRLAALERSEMAEAELVGVEAGLAGLVAVIRSIGGYLRSEQQQAVWAAEAWLADRARSVPR